MKFTTIGEFANMILKICLIVSTNVLHCNVAQTLPNGTNNVQYKVSANVAQTFAGFAARGKPGFGVPPWTQDQPSYLRIDKVHILCLILVCDIFFLFLRTCQWKATTQSSTILLWNKVEIEQKHKL